ncbi:MAG: HAD-IB family phosphatase [Anaerolineae bacterium]|nr:HAD-IB family phosphatase [Anaerolineae bacterium]
MSKVNGSWQTDLFQPDWPGFDFVFFDCDSTLSTIEGIDELARQKGKFDEVKRMTDAAMEGEVHLQNVYDRRLELLCPTRAEIRALERHYRETVVADAREVIEALKFFNKELFIVSGGLLAAVRPFGEWLGVARQNIRAVDVRYNRLSGRWWDYQQDRWGQRPDVEYLDAEKTPLIESQGKADVVRDLLPARSGRSVLVGDGMSDLAARPAVNLVVGFGGVITRQNVVNEAEVFVKSPTLAPILALALSGSQRHQVQLSPYHALLKKGWGLIKNGEVIFQDEEI